MAWPAWAPEFDFRARVATVATTFVACALRASCSNRASLTSAPSTLPKLNSGSACGAMRKMCLKRMTPAASCVTPASTCGGARGPRLRVVCGVWSSRAARGVGQLQVRILTHPDVGRPRPARIAPVARFQRRGVLRRRRVAGDHGRMQRCSTRVKPQPFLQPLRHKKRLREISRADCITICCHELWTISTVFCRSAAIFCRVSS